MKMTRSREILSAILQCIIAVSTAVLLFSFVLNLTFVSPNYFGSHFPSAQVAAQCDEQLTMKYETLSKESGFPVRVFEMVKKDYPTVQAVSRAVSGIATNDEVNFYTQNQIDYFYHLCEEYAKGNGVKYTKADLEATAKEASKIYNDTVSIRGADSAAQKAKALKHAVTLSQLLSAVALAVCGTATVIMFSRKRLGYQKLLCATGGGGLGVLGASALLFLIKPAQHLYLEPQVYADGISRMTGRYFFVTALLAVGVIAVSYAIMIQQELKYQKSKDKVKIT